jgi:biopolymer transport protein ExbB/TolQ
LEILAILLILGTIILLLLVIAVYQIKMAGMHVKDFWTFIKANDTLDKLYAFIEKYERLSPQQQVLFLSEAEKVFDAFDKVPNALWEEEYNKYMKILNKYKDIKILRWKESSPSK